MFIYISYFQTRYIKTETSENGFVVTSKITRNLFGDQSYVWQTSWSSQESFCQSLLSPTFSQGVYCTLKQPQAAIGVGDTKEIV